MLKSKSNMAPKTKKGKALAKTSPLVALGAAILLGLAPLSGCTQTNTPKAQEDQTQKATTPKTQTQEVPVTEEGTGKGVSATLANPDIVMHPGGKGSVDITLKASDEIDQSTFPISIENLQDTLSGQDVQIEVLSSLIYSMVGQPDIEKGEDNSFTIPKMSPGDSVTISFSIEVQGEGEKTGSIPIGTEESVPFTLTVTEDQGSLVDTPEGKTWQN